MCVGSVWGECVWGGGGGGGNARSPDQVRRLGVGPPTWSVILGESTNCDVGRWRVSQSVVSTSEPTCRGWPVILKA